MFHFKNSTSIIAKEMLKKCPSIYGIKTIKSSILGKKIRIIAMAMVIMLLTTVAVMATNYRVGYTVKVDDTVLGTVATKGEYYEVLNQVKEEVDNISQIEFTPVSTEEFNMEIVPVHAFTEKEELAENLKAISDGMVQAYTITYDSEFVVAVDSEQSAYSLKEDYLNSFYSEAYEEIAFGGEVLVSESHVPQDTILTYEDALAELLKGKYIFHQVTETDNLDALAESYEVSPEDILADNEISELIPGEKIKIYTKEPVLPIKTVEYINGNVDIPFEIVQKEDSTLYRGQKSYETRGVAGKKYLNAYITRINGIITEENVIESVILQEPVTQVELIGTKELPQGVGTGEFIMPTSGTLTSSFGRRWGRSHQGIDIGASTGTPIYAADDGIVLESEYKSNGYGNIVRIDHRNGFITYYAHCSSLHVKAGDVVEKGDLIATVGSTGRSTGPHLHFEIRRNEVPQNPYNYIK